MKKRMHERRCTELEEIRFPLAVAVSIGDWQNSTRIQHVLSIKIHHSVYRAVTNSVFRTHLLKGAE
jgi:hypothetical protein